MTRPTNLTLLRTIVRQQPTSIRETARLADRDVRQVHRNLEELDELGVIDLKANGRTKRPTIWYDSTKVNLPLFDFENNTETSAEE